MHHAFAALSRLAPMMERIDGIVRQHGLTDIKEYSSGSEGQLLLLHEATIVSKLQWYAQIEDATKTDPQKAFMCVTLEGDNNLIELTWPGKESRWDIFVQLEEADAVRRFYQHFQVVLDRASRTCSDDEAFELTNAMAALVAKG